MELYYPGIKLEWKKDNKHLYSKYCECHKDHCICLITKVSFSRTMTQEVIVNGLLKDTIDLKKYPQYIPKTFKDVERAAPIKPILNNIVNKAFKIIKKNHKLSHEKGSNGAPTKIKKQEIKKQEIKKQKIKKQKIKLHKLPNQKTDNNYSKELNNLLEKQKSIKLSKSELRRIYVLKNKNKYQCKPCNFKTHDLAGFKKHKKSKRHFIVIKHH